MSTPRSAPRTLTERASLTVLRIGLWLGARSREGRERARIIAISHHPAGKGLRAPDGAA